MRKCAWPLACVALLAAAGLSGCGGGGGGTTAPATTAAVTTSTTTSTTVPGQATADDVYKSCLDALGTALSNRMTQRACTQVRDTFQQCTTAASNAPEGSARDAALKACQQAANKATAQFRASP